ncbi:NAD(P)-binding protein [Glonium stellatum]|uniref:NAD(P)-binding protein n=1 Tax=Glonium stellatum TaxID=574774 RepID=A0A8E2JRR3_9PEZI|nr:NAD(P)-binding protein [Glonium stellatum]
MTDAKKYTSKFSSARILIIGGSSGIGFGVAEACLEYGATVTISSSSSQKVQNAISALQSSYPSTKSRVFGHACNLNDPSTLDSNIAALFSKVGTLDHVVFTAGDHLAIRPIAEADFQFIEKAGMVRFFAPLLVAKHAAKHLTPGPASSITLTTGVISERPEVGWTVVNSFATGVHGMARGLALDLAPIRVNAVSLGGVDTPLWKGISAEFQERLLQRTCTGAIGKTITLLAVS